MRFTKNFAIAIISLFSFQDSFGQSPLPAVQVVQVATKEAAGSGKNVLVIFHASWCGWCKRMDTSLVDPLVKEVIAKRFVITHLTIQEHDPQKKLLENAGGEVLRKGWGGTNAGLPFFVLLGADGKLIANSLDAAGNNIGCPASAGEVDTFLSMLRNLGGFSESELDNVRTVFRRNDR